MKAQSFFEQNGGTYTQVGDILIPDLSAEESRPFGRWGQMRRRYLREHHPAVYSNMLLNGTLYPHLAEIDEATDERIDLITKQLAVKRGITEKLKADNHFCWVQEMNAIRASAEEAVLSELIYALTAPAHQFYHHNMADAWSP